MKVSKNWLKELVDFKQSFEVFIELLNLRTIGTKEVTDKFIELDMKGYNRADLLSLRGVALESAAILGSKVNFSEIEPASYYWTDKSLPSTPVSIEDEDLAQIQCVAKIEGLKFGNSPKEWVERLNDSGMRSVNNIADVTNLVMLEYGQPLHSFDEVTVKDDTINVRRAKDGEELKTLDGKLRKLTSEDIVLADEEKALDVAGVMGGLDTEIKETTQTILLSASLFNPTMVRRTGTRLGLTSEASKRFYHGLSKKRLLQAFDAAIRMYEKELGGKVTAVTLKGDFEDILEKIPVSLEKINSLIGVEFSSSQVEDYLKRLNFEIKNVTPESWVVTPPYYRLDVSIEEDVIEEVARMYGYEKIKPKALPGEKPEPADQNLFNLMSNLRKTLVDLGLTEVQTYSFYSTQVLDTLGFNEENKHELIKIVNPISAETEYLRQTGWANLVEAVGKNLRQGLKDVAIFEIGKIYWKHPEEGISEKFVLSVALTNETENPVAELNNILSQLNQKLNLGFEIKYGPPDQDLGLFHPKRLGKVLLNEKQIGGIGEIHKRVLDKLGIQKRVAVFEFNLRDFKLS